MTTSDSVVMIIVDENLNIKTSLDRTAKSPEAIYLWAYFSERYVRYVPS